MCACGPGTVGGASPETASASGTTATVTTVASSSSSASSGAGGMGAGGMSSTAETATTGAGASTPEPPKEMDLHDAILFDNPKNLADWPVSTKITEVVFQPGGKDGVRIEFSKKDGPGRWPDITPPGWD